MQETRRLHGKDLTVSKELAKKEKTLSAETRAKQKLRGLSSDSSIIEQSAVKQSVYIVDIKKGEIYGRSLNVVFSAVKNGIILA